MPPINVDIIEKAKTLKDRDSHLQDTDAIIAAQALLDPVSQRLLTVDTVLLNSQAIKNEEKRMRENNERQSELKVVDGL